jgi:hypothetical protein
MTSYPVAWDCGPVRGERSRCDYESDSTRCADTTLNPRPLASASERSSLFSPGNRARGFTVLLPSPRVGERAGGEGKDRAPAAFTRAWGGEVVDGFELGFWVRKSQVR